MNVGYFRIDVLIILILVVTLNVKTDYNRPYISR